MPAEPRARAPAASTGNVIRDSALGRVPETVELLIRLTDRVWRNPHVSPALLEILRLRNARTVNCVFCKAVRYDVARRDGLTEERAGMVRDGYESSALSEREKLVIGLADAYLGFPAGASPDLMSRLRTAFTEAEIATMFVALMTFNVASRTAVSLGGMPEGPLPVTEVSLGTITG